MRGFCVFPTATFSTYQFCPLNRSCYRYSQAVAPAPASAQASAPATYAAPAATPAPAQPPASDLAPATSQAFVTTTGSLLSLSLKPMVQQ